MSVVAFRARVWMRRSARQLAVTALLIGVVGGLTIGLASGTRRTASAPDRYTRATGGDPDLLITQLSGRPITDEVAKVPGVASAASFTFLTAFLTSPEDGAPMLEPNPFAGADDLMGARLVEGRFVNQAAPDEFTANTTFATFLHERFGTRVGDRFDVAAYDQEQITGNFDFSEPPRVTGVSATLVGITEMPSDFDEPSLQLVFSSAFLDAHPTLGVAHTLIAVRLDGDADVDAVLSSVRAMPDGADAYPSQVRVVSDDARRAVRFQVTALWIVTTIALLAAAIVVLQLVGRMLAMAELERSTLLAIGWTPRSVAVERSVEAGIVAVLAAPVAAVVGYLLTAVFPLGVLRKFEIDRRPRLDLPVTLLGLVAGSLIVVVGGALTARRPERAIAVDDQGSRLGSWLATIGAGFAPVLGARLASNGPRGVRSSMRSLVAGVIAMAGLAGGWVVGTSLTTVVDEPARWGVNYDQLYGNPFVPADEDIAAPFVEERDIAALSAATFGSLTIDGHDVEILAFDAIKGGLLPTAIEGRAPATDDEIGMGAEVARRLHVDVGDEVEVIGTTGEARVARVVGLIVTPENAGNGAAMTFDGYLALSPSATKNILLVRFRDGAPPGTAEAIGAANYSPPDAIATPTSIRSLERVTAAPFLLASVLAVLLAMTWAYLLPMSMRARRRDLAVLRALGSDRWQVRRILHWQATFTAAAIACAGIPLGVIAGRSVVALLTTSLGIVPGADVPWLALVLLAMGAVALANIVIVVPAARASRTGIGTILRDR